MTIRVLLADDHVVVRQGLRALLEREGFQVVGEASDGREATRLARRLQPDVAVLDVGMPLLNGLDAARAIRRAVPGTRLVALTVHTEPEYVRAALAAGMTGYVLKSQASEQLLNAVREVHAGAVYLGPGLADNLGIGVPGAGRSPEPALTLREREVLQLVAEGKTTKEVAQILGVSVKTADSHRSRLMEKLEIHETASLVRYAVRRGLVQP